MSMLFLSTISAACCLLFWFVLESPVLAVLPQLTALLIFFVFPSIPHPHSFSTHPCSGKLASVDSITRLPYLLASNDFQLNSPRFILQASSPPHSVSECCFPQLQLLCLVAPLPWLFTLLQLIPLLPLRPQLPAILFPGSLNFPFSTLTPPTSVEYLH